LSEIVGHVDARDRPLMRVALPDGDQSFLAVVDTGFNGWLMMEATDARNLKFALSDASTSVELAEGGRKRVEIARGEIMWFGRCHPIEVFVSTGERARAAADEPIALVGTRLLSPHRLEIDFEKRLVRIQARE
jgi:predicted aspartyl protease